MMNNQTQAITGCMALAIQVMQQHRLIKHEDLSQMNKHTLLDLHTFDDGVQAAIVKFKDGNKALVEQIADNNWVNRWAKITSLCPSDPDTVQELFVMLKEVDINDYTSALSLMQAGYDALRPVVKTSNNHVKDLMLSLLGAK